MRPLPTIGDQLDCGHFATDPGPEGGSMNYLRDGRTGETQCLDCFAAKKRRDPSPFSRCACGFWIALGETMCAECLCEEDGQ